MRRITRHEVNGVMPVIIVNDPMFSFHFDMYRHCASFMSWR
jgi:hypothetical protein